MEANNIAFSYLSWHGFTHRNGTETIGADTLMNQLGRIGVIRKKRI
jgi:hypothetical protein